MPVEEEDVVAVEVLAAGEVQTAVAWGAVVSHVVTGVAVAVLLRIIPAAVVVVVVAIAANAIERLDAKVGLRMLSTVSLPLPNSGALVAWALMAYEYLNWLDGHLKISQFLT